ncbi:MAG: hypothetical protein ACUVT1_13565 [Anaerolineae bacterium]
MGGESAGRAPPGGRLLEVVMNSDADEAFGYLRTYAGEEEA